MMLKATKVDGVFDKDPKIFNDAKIFKTITYSEVIQKELKVMDTTAMVLCKENSIPLRIFNVTMKNSISKVIVDESIGTKGNYMIDELKKEASQKMTKSMESLSNNLSKIRTGRAHPSILDTITVEYYGQVPLNQVANIKIEDAKTLQLNVWEKNMIKEVEKSIISSDLGLNPALAIS